MTTNLVAYKNKNLFFHSSRDQSPKSVLEGMVPSKGSREEPVSLAFPASPDRLCSLACGSFHLHINSTYASFRRWLSLHPSYKNPSDYTGPTCIISSSQAP